MHFNLIFVRSGFGERFIAALRVILLNVLMKLKIAGQQ